MYSPDNIDEQLDTATQGFLSGNSVVNKKDRTIELSMLFKWYQEDFGGNDENIIEWIKTHSPELATHISELSATTATLPAAKIALKFPTYNWNINSQS